MRLWRQYKDGRWRVNKCLHSLDDVCVLTTPERVGDVYRALQEELFRLSRIRIHVGKTQVCNAAGIRPGACDML